MRCDEVTALLPGLVDGEAIGFEAERDEDTSPPDAPVGSSDRVRERHRGQRAGRGRGHGGPHRPLPQTGSEPRRLVPSGVAAPRLRPPGPENALLSLLSWPPWPGGQ
jgi:hypothetical protein